MDNARKKIRICLVCVVTAAIIFGLLYYFNDVRGGAKIDEGTLVRREREISLEPHYAERHMGMPESRG